MTLPHGKNWLERKPSAVTSTENISVLRNFYIQTDWVIQASRFDTIVNNYTEKDSFTY